MKTVTAQNSLGRDKEMDLEEYTKRAVTDHRCMCTTVAQFEKAEALLAAQKELAESCFNCLYEAQQKQKEALAIHA